MKIVEIKLVFGWFHAARCQPSVGSSQRRRVGNFSSMRHCPVSFQTLHFSAIMGSGAGLRSRHYPSFQRSSNRRIGSTRRPVVEAPGQKTFRKVSVKVVFGRAWLKGKSVRDKQTKGQKTFERSRFGSSPLSASGVYLYIVAFSKTWQGACFKVSRLRGFGRSRRWNPFRHAFT